MNIKDIATIVLSSIAILISLFTAYKSFLAKFNGKVWISNRLALTNIDRVPSLGIATFFENNGAKAGLLDDLRIRIEQKESATTFVFYPLLMRNDYSIFKDYSDADWFPFSTVLIQPKTRTERYLLFKPLNDYFKTRPGKMIITLDVKWHQKEKWESVSPKMSFTLDNEISRKWGDFTEPAHLILSDGAMRDRE
jgi:hypothetical protein